MVDIPMCTLYKGMYRERGGYIIVWDRLVHGEYPIFHPYIRQLDSFLDLHFHFQMGFHHLSHIGNIMYPLDPPPHIHFHLYKDIYYVRIELMPVYCIGCWNHRLESTWTCTWAMAIFLCTFSHDVIFVPAC
jgi:hypothetical protein